MNPTPATTATRLGSGTAGRGAATGSVRRGSVFTVVGKRRSRHLDDAWCEDIRVYRELMDVSYGHPLRMTAFETTLAYTQQVNSS